jgi:hypothetical protein
VATHLTACPDCGQDRDALVELVRVHEITLEPDDGDPAASEQRVAGSN